MKIGITIVVVGGIVIVALLGVLAFVKPAKNDSVPGSFKGPTSPPHINGPQDLPPGSN